MAGECDLGLKAEVVGVEGGAGGPGTGRQDAGEVLRGLGQLGVNQLSQLGPQYLMRLGGIRSPGMPL